MGESAWRLKMPIYKVHKDIKDGKQKYKVRVNYISEDGSFKQLTRSIYGSEEAKELERELIRGLKAKGENSVKKMTVEKLQNELIVTKKFEVRETTLNKYKNTYRYFIQEMYEKADISKITASSLQKWKLSMEQKDLSLSTRKFAFNYFKSMFSYAVRMEYIQANPFEKLKNFKDPLSTKQEMIVYTIAEFNKFSEIAREVAEKKQSTQQDLSEWDYYVFFNIAFYTGLRKGEIYALKWSDINGSYITVNRTLTQRMTGGDRETPPKNRSSARTLQIPLTLTKILKEHRLRQVQANICVDDSRICGGEVSVRDNTVQRRRELYAEKAGLNVIRLHDFRHSHVSVLANAGINIQEIARRIGHSRIEMTWNTYSHMYPKEQEKAVDIFDKPE